MRVDHAEFTLLEAEKESAGEQAGWLYAFLPRWNRVPLEPASIRS